MTSIAKIALVTGGSRGLGKDMALNLARNHNDVIITYHSRQDEAQKVITAIEELGRKAVALPFDAGQPAAIPEFAAALRNTLSESFGTSGFDFLINNAGIGIHASFAETSEEQFDSLMNVHVKSVYFLTQQLHSLINEGGRIVNLSSGLARFTTPGYSAYAAMKGAVEVLTRYMAKELGSRKITVNTVAPGPIETDFGGGVVRDISELNKQLAALSVFGRVGVAEDIGGVVAFLCSEAARWVTGQRIEVSGGINL